MKSVALKFPAIRHHLITKPLLFSSKSKFYPLPKIMTSSSKPITDFFPPSKRAKKTNTIGKCTSPDGGAGPTPIKKNQKEDVGSGLSEEQKVRAEFNKSLAKAKSNLRVCKERLIKCEIFILYHVFCLISV